MELLRLMLEEEDIGRHVGDALALGVPDMFVRDAKTFSMVSVRDAPNSRDPSAARVSRPCGVQVSFGSGAAMRLCIMEQENRADAVMRLTDAGI